MLCVWPDNQETSTRTPRSQAAPPSSWLYASINDANRGNNETGMILYNSSTLHTAVAATNDRKLTPGWGRRTQQRGG
jgi:hypothetical protein